MWNLYVWGRMWEGYGNCEYYLGIVIHVQWKQQ